MQQIEEKIIYSLASIKKYFPLKLKIILLKSLFYPHLEYGLNLWGSGNIKEVRKLQKWAIRTVFNKPNLSHTEPLFKLANCLNIDDLYKLRVLTTLRKSIENTSPNILQCMFKFHPCKNRIKNVFDNPPRINALIDKLPSSNFPSVWNTQNQREIPIDICSSIKAFVNTKKKDMIDNYKMECHKIECYVCNSYRQGTQN